MTLARGNEGGCGPDAILAMPSPPEGGPVGRSGGEYVANGHPTTQFSGNERVCFPRLRSPSPEGELDVRLAAPLPSILTGSFIPLSNGSSYTKGAAIKWGGCLRGEDRKLTRPGAGGEITPLRAHASLWGLRDAILFGLVSGWSNIPRCFAGW